MGALGRLDADARKTGMKSKIVVTALAALFSAAAHAECGHYDFVCQQKENAAAKEQAAKEHPEARVCGPFQLKCRRDARAAYLRGDDLPACVAGDTSCTLQREQVLASRKAALAAQDAADSQRFNSLGSVDQSATTQDGQKVYRASDCIGAVVAGVCHGAISGAGLGQPRPTCHGQMLNGQCTGPMF
jgi:hypothetical protein